MTKEDLIKWAISKGWELDHAGFPRKRWRDKTYRIRLAKETAFGELLREDIGTNRWETMMSQKYRRLSISEEGDLEGMVVRL